MTDLAKIKAQICTLFEKTVENGITEQKIKAMAKKLKKAHAIPHSQALEVIAHSLGFQSYRDMKDAHFPSDRTIQKFARRVEDGNVAFDSNDLDKTPIPAAIAHIHPGMQPIDQMAAIVVFDPHNGDVK